LIFFALDFLNFQLKILHSLVTASGGRIVLHKEFSECSSDLKYITHKKIGKEGTLCIRSSNQISVTHLIGPAIETSDNDELAYSCKMTGVSAYNSFCIFFEITENTMDQIYFQFIIKYISNIKGSTTYRVITYPMKTTVNVNTIINAIDSDLTALIIAKKTILKARKLPSSKVLQELDEDIKKISDYCTKQNNDVIPQHIDSLRKKLFILRRGTMLGHILQNPDEIDYIRTLFLYSDYEDSLRLLEPILYETVFNQDGEYLNVLPLEDLALQSNLILLLDNHNDIFIWSGKEVSGPEFDGKREKILIYAKSISKNRIPNPRILNFIEGDPDSRFLQSRLIPSHKDLPQQQLQSFPQLQKLTIEERKKLISKFHKTDDQSYIQFIDSLV